MSKRILNAVLCVAFLALLVALPIRNLLFADAPGNARGQGFLTASYIMLCLFGSLSLVFGFRAARGSGRKVPMHAMSSPQSFRITVCGDVVRCRAVAQIAFAGEQFAEVFESSDGWHLEIAPADAAAIPPDIVSGAVAAAKERLSLYVNRRGEYPPVELTHAGLSLWLLQKSNGSAMDQHFPAS